MIELLQKSRIEILQLRRRNEVLSAQVEVVQIFAAALGMRREGGAMAPDIAWELKNEINRLGSEQNAHTGEDVPKKFIREDFSGD